MTWTLAIYLALTVLFVLLLAALMVGYELLRRDFRKLQRADRSAEGLDRARRIQELLGELKSQVERAGDVGQEELDRLWRKADGSLSSRLDQAGQTVEQVRDSLAAIRDASQRIVQLGSQLSGLSEALRLPPAGSAGDGQVWLADLLGQMLPPQHYQLNVSLGGGEPIDAAVRLGSHMIAIDAKFPVAPGANGSEGSEGSSADSIARQHVDRIARQCILPERGTVDFALMYLPAEGIYYDLVIRSSHRPDSFANYALARRVIPVSPNTLYAYLYTIVLGLRGLQVEQQAERIIERLRSVREQFDRLTDAFQSFGAHLDHTSNRFDAAQRQLTRFGQSLDDALSDQPASDPMQIQLPFDDTKPRPLVAEDVKLPPLAAVPVDPRPLVADEPRATAPGPAPDPAPKTAAPQSSGLLPGTVQPFQPNRAKRRRRR